MRDIEEVIKHYTEFAGIHPACLAVPEMSEEDFQTLLESIKTQGLSQPIVRTHNGLLLDGRHRLLACHEAGQDIRVRTLLASADPWLEVATANIARRNLTQGQKAIFAAKMNLAVEKERAKERQAENAKSLSKVLKPTNATNPQTNQEAFPYSEKQQGQARDLAGAQVGVTGRTVQKAANVVTKAPDLAEKVQNREISLEEAHRQTKARENKAVAPTQQPTQEECEMKTKSKKAPRMPKVLPTEHPIITYGKELRQLILEEKRNNWAGTIDKMSVVQTVDGLFHIVND